MSERPKIVIVIGATASGKTGIGVALAKEFDGEIISADSRQAYRKLDIGTAKITPEEMQGVPHHLIDVADVDESYSAADFKRGATNAITDITSRSKLPIIVGGTFFYIDTLLERSNMPDVPPDPELRAYLEDLSSEALYAHLEELDPERAFTIDRQNKRRLIRALEVVHAIGKVPGQDVHECPYDTLEIGIEVSKDALRARYRERAADWLKRGFKSEVEQLLTAGVTRDRLLEIGFEYQLMLAHIDGELDEVQFIQRFEEKNWQYAKRQYTWLKRNDAIAWFPYADVDAIKTRTAIFLEK